MEKILRLIKIKSRNIAANPINSLIGSRITITLFIVSISQLYYHMVGDFWNSIDTTHDLSFVLGLPLVDLVTNQYQHYMYGLIPLLLSWILIHFMTALMAFKLLTTVTSILFACVITGFVNKYIRVNIFFRAMLSLVLTCLFMNPGHYLFSWKLPFTLSAPLGVLFAIAFFICSIKYFDDSKFRNLLLLMLSGAISLCFKLELTFTILVYFTFYTILFSFKRSGKSMPFTKFGFIILWSIFLPIAYLNWQKYFPPSIRYGSWARESILHTFFFDDTISSPGSHSYLLTNFLFFFGLSDFGVKNMLDIFAQVSFFISLAALKGSQTLSSPIKRIKLAKTIIFFYIFYMVAAFIQNSDSVFRNLSVAMIAIFIFHVRSLKSDTKFLFFAVFSILFSCRVFFNVQFNHYFIFFGFPLFILILSLISRFYPRIILILFLMLLFAVLTTRVSRTDFFQNKRGASVLCADGREYRVAFALKRTITVIKDLQKLMPIKTIGSSRNMPFLNTCLNKPNPIRLLMNSEFLAFWSPHILMIYLSALKENLPDIFVYSERLILSYFFHRRHYTQESFDDGYARSNLFKRKLDRLFETIITLPTTNLWNPDKPLFNYIYCHPKSENRNLSNKAD